MINIGKNTPLSIVLLAMLAFLAGCAEKPIPRKLHEIGGGFQFREGTAFPKEIHDITVQPDVTPYECTVTPGFDLHFPKVKIIGKTNNLWRKPGSPDVAYGQPIYIKGIVTDKNCVPLPNVTVEIWHGDDKGYYRLGKEDSIDNMLMEGEEGLDMAFKGSGTSYTNNMGEFSFITILPGVQGKEVSHLKFRAKHEDFDAIVSKMYFEELDNMKDDDYINLTAKKRKALTAVTDPAGLNPMPESMTYYFNISMDGEGRYRSY